jgi:hypothetical protein
MAWQCDHCLLVLDDDPHFDEHLRRAHRLNQWSGDPLNLSDFGTTCDEDEDEDAGAWRGPISPHGHRPV